METNLLELNIGLSSNTSLGDEFAIYLKDSIGANYNIIGNFVEQRLGRYQIEIGATTEQTLANMKTSLILDHGSDFSIVAVGSNISLTSKTEGWLYLDSNFGQNTPIIITPGTISISPFLITSVEFLEASTEKCSKVKLRITTNDIIASYCINQVCNPLIPSSNSLEVDVYRGAMLMIDLVSFQGPTIHETIQIPSTIEDNINKVKIAFNSGLSGTTVNVFAPFSDQFEHQYSLDGIHWQLNNSFPGLLSGDYTLYIKDPFGCNKSIPFSVLEQNFGSAYVFISKENSFRFIEPKSNYQNDENREYCSSPSKLNYGYIQEFLATDIITTQFKSNYQGVSVSLFDEINNTVDSVPINKVSNNIGIKVKYNQVKKYSISATQFGIYFENGQVLDYNTNSLNDTYNLNGELPIWAKLGNIIEIDGVSYIIDNIGFDEGVNAEVLIFNGISSNTTNNVIVSCIYNLQDYEVYEFVLDLSFYPNTKIRLEINNTDPNFGNYKWVSEIISISEELNDYLEIRYFNSTNTNVVYATGIQHLLRLPYNTIKANDIDSNENYKTDANAHLLKADIYEITDFEFLPFPLELFRKLKIALSMDNVYIDGVGYSKNAEFTKEHLGSTNLYKLTASMIKNGFVFNSSQNNSEILVDGAINVPGLIEINSNGNIAL